jgi:peptidoglycan hydrolase-like protein with peptidoglycan-binding domain
VKRFVIAMIAVLAIAGLCGVSTVTLAASVPIGQLNMDAVPDLGSDGVRKVQTLLKDRGFDPGPIDGVAGPRTNAAVRTFQERYGIKASGTIDNQTLFALGAVDLAS